MNYVTKIESVDVSIPQDYHDILKKAVDFYFIVKLSLFNMFCSLVMGFIGYLLVGISIWMGYLTYISACLIFGIIHRLGHVNIISFWYQAHAIGHHIHAYPLKKFLTNDYQIDADSFRITNQIFLVISPIYIFIFKLISAYTWSQMSMIMIYVLVISFIEDEIHSQIHMQKSRFNNYEWFQKLRYLHYLHHRGVMKQNYAMKDFFIDISTGNMMLSV